MLSLIFRNWELILLILSQPPWEKKADLPKVMCWDTVDPVCHTGALLPPLSGRQQAGAEEHDGKIFLFSDHLPRGSTSGSDRVSKPPPRAASTSLVKNKGTGGKKSNRRKRLEKMFLCSLTWKKKNQSVQHEGICVSENSSSWTCLLNRSYNSSIAKWKL